MRRRGRAFLGLVLCAGFSVGASAAAPAASLLSRKQARRARHRIRAGKRVKARFEGSAIDATGTRGPTAEFEARLVLE
jgi:hypothetical protein